MQECARMFSGRSIMKPQCFIEQLRLDVIGATNQETETPKQKRKPPVPTYK